MTTPSNAPDWCKLRQHERNRDLNHGETVKGSRCRLGHVTQATGQLR